MRYFVRDPGVCEFIMIGVSTVSAFAGGGIAYMLDCCVATGILYGFGVGLVAGTLIVGKLNYQMRYREINKEEAIRRLTQ